MPRATRIENRKIPILNPTLVGLNVDVLKWYAAALPGQVPARKGYLVAYLLAQLLDPEVLSSLLAFYAAHP